MSLADDWYDWPGNLPGGRMSACHAAAANTATALERLGACGTDAAKKEKQSDSLPSDYLVSRTPAVQLDVQPASAIDKATEKPAEKPSESPPPASPLPPIDPPRPFDSPQPSMEVRPAPLSRPDAPSVQLLRALLDHRAEEEINEQVKSYDPATREALLLLLSSVVQLEQVGGMARIAPRDLAAWTDRLNTLTACLRGRAQLILERMCFCSYINNFGDFAPLPPEHTCFHPGEEARVYVQVRNFSCRRQQDKFVTVLKGRMEIYDENNRATPPIIWASEPRRTSAPRRAGLLHQFSLSAAAQLSLRLVHHAHRRRGLDGCAAGRQASAALAHRSADARFSRRRTHRPPLPRPHRRG